MTIVEERGAAPAQPSNRARPMTGNEAIARGAWEAGVKVGASYPGTPSTEVMENLAKYPPTDVYAQWSTNEKVALDVACGASLAGVRALASMKHVGLNVAADALMSQSYIGVNGGLVIVVCDDPGIHSSQNEQDSRIFGRFAQVPVMEPADAQEALDYTRAAFQISEEYDTPVIVRSTTRLSHTRSAVMVGEREEAPVRGFIEKPSKNVMIPAHARTQHPLILERTARLAEDLEGSEFFHWRKGDTKVGVVTASTSYAYVMENLPDAGVLKLGFTNPMPRKLIEDFCAAHERILVVEELEPVIEEQLKIWGLEVEGKEYFSRLGELSPEAVRDGFIKAGVLEGEEAPPPFEFEQQPRPPVLCAGCPHAMSYQAVRGLDARVAGDIGCYTLAVVDPIAAIDMTVSMGSSIANAVGMDKAGTETKPIVAAIGDSTFIHAGITPLIDAVYNDANITVLLLDNHITAMTGGQDHPGTGKNIRGTPAHKIDFEEICRAVGVKWIRRVDTYDAATITQIVREAIDFTGVSVVISDRPCVLDPVKIKGPSLTVKAENCTACQICMNLGCPALLWSDEWFEGRHKVRIEQSSCIGCSVCGQFCPTGAITALPEVDADA